MCSGVGTLRMDTRCANCGQPLGYHGAHGAECVKLTAKGGLVMLPEGTFTLSRRAALEGRTK